MDVGLALWNMQSTAAAPANPTLLYRRLVTEARLAEELGFHSLWLGEHRFWYDGWCPAPLLAASAVAAATDTLRVGTAMLLLPMHDATSVAADAAEVHRASAGRLELGVGLGYRDSEFDGLGVPRTRRGKLMEANLDALEGAWGRAGATRPRVWVGGMADAAVARAAQRGLSLLLPPTLHTGEVADAVGRARAAAASAGTELGRVGIVKDCWVEPDRDRAQDFFLPRLAAAYHEYAAWWVFKGGFTGSERPELAERQVERASAAAIVGDPDDLAAAVDGLAGAGVDLVALQMHRDTTRGPDWERSVQLAAATLLTGAPA